MDLPDGELRGKVGPWAHLMTLHNVWLCLPFRGRAGVGRGWGAISNCINWKNEKGSFVFVMSPVLLTHRRTYQLLAKCPNEVPETCLVKHGTTSMSALITPSP